MLTDFEQTIYWWYFLIHIPISIFIDTSIITEGRTLHPIFKKAINWHTVENNDYLVGERPKWLQFFVWTEMFYQLPLFFIAVLYGTTTIPETFLKLYGLLAGGSSLWCLIDIVFNGHYFLLNPKKHTPRRALPIMAKLKLALFYFPYFLLPTRLLFL
ncbi:hypothetical protein TBLA_0D02590 [Henningerozyma blattae CBS 6284]|uniref:Efficient mitochondria targeting-associated protein 19 n=1 Tax=Henningerozyma blattae (strain ATCC 34711 / CBS 6284 / DSM 70876 / NBRC 10599 / NRRL Y-10934 / UCD 77-7) TaxID=1071380 RepID=I2H310_HENB6|nr:hypothetical protein TBLA_0D02590 [Tetrapisispora blattae CBS 6284]CCH60762.1 hypothetical protein TBLA_0D02590 [Tetrapisispora blattae CBS 6284]